MTQIDNECNGIKCVMIKKLNKSTFACTVYTPIIAFMCTLG